MSKNNKTRKRRILKKSIKPFPCENCLTLAICKATSEKCETSYQLLEILTKECSLLKQYIETPHHHNKSYNERRLYQSFSKIKHRENIVKRFFRTQHSKYPWNNI